VQSQSDSAHAYRRIVNAWCMYDWANSAFATTILAAVLPIYYSQVAAATLPSEARATAYWSAGISISLLIAAVIAPILGTVSDVVRGKKRFLAAFAGMGIIGTSLLILVNTGDWLLASILFVIGRIGFTAANVFYDALLPHVAREDDRDRVSTRGYALGYLGGGLLLAINVAMIQILPGTWGPRFSFLSVGIWWAIFSIPLLTRVPEPAGVAASLAPGKNVVTVSFRQLKQTFQNIRRYRELFKFLIAFLIYNDGIGTIISVSAIYGAELGFSSVELILALLLVQFAGIPFSLIFGRLPSRAEKRRPFYLAFILFSLVCLPVVGVVTAHTAPSDLTGAPMPVYTSVEDAVGEGNYTVTGDAIITQGDWHMATISSEVLHTHSDAVYLFSNDPGAAYKFVFNGQKVETIYSTGPENGIWAVELDGEPVMDTDTRAPMIIDSYNSTLRYGVRRTFTAPVPGVHTLRLINTGERNPASQGTQISVARIKVLSPIRHSNLLLILGLILAVEFVGILFALLTRSLFKPLAEKLNTRRSIILALSVYSIIAVWGYFLNSMVEFWFLAWMVATVQGGSQALSRSLYASLSPKAKSGEFFGLYGVMEKFSAILGPLLFAAAATAFDSSRPAIFSLIVLFLGGIYLLLRVNIAEGQRIARAEDEALMAGRGES